jgi:hypothetical protein
VGDKIEKNEMGGACSADERAERRVHGFGGKLRERDHWGDPGVDRNILLSWIFRKLDLGVWTELRWLRIKTVGGYLCVRK